MRHLRLALIAVVATVVPVATTTPAAASTQLAQCGGTAPLVTSCATTGTMPSSVGNFRIGCAGVVATIRVSVTTDTGSDTFTCLPVSNVAYYAYNRVVTGTFYVSQSFSLTGEVLNGAGAGNWYVDVEAL